MSIFDFVKKRSKSNRLETNNLSKKTKKTIIYFEDVYKRCLDKYDFNINELSQFYENNACINCGCVLDDQIKISKNCPMCKNKIIVKTDMYSKKKIFISREMQKIYDKYDKDIKEILFMERIIKNKIAIYNNYIFKFNELKKNEKFSAKDIMFQFSNYVGNELDNKAYKEYVHAAKLKPQDRILNSFNAILDFKKANQEYMTLYKICIFEKKYNVAISLLADIVYRDIQIMLLDLESNPYHKISNDDVKNYIRIKQIDEILSKYNYNFEDFKKIFIENRHPFILPMVSNSDAWKYIEKFIKQK